MSQLRLVVVVLPALGGTLAGLAAIVATLTALLAALLVLGSHFAVQGASARLRLAWFGALTSLLVAALAAGLLALVLNGLA